MMKKMFSIVAALLLGLVAVSEPVKSMLGVESAEMQIEEEEQNLWVWPTELVGLKWGTPRDVRHWETGVWYSQVANNGYSNTPDSLHYFTENAFHNRNGGGYSMYQFFILESGTYEISYNYICQTPSDVAEFYAHDLYYDDSVGGWLFKSQLAKQLSFREVHDEFKSEGYVFEIADDAMVGMTVTGINKVDHREIDVWNVVLKKVD